MKKLLLLLAPLTLGLMVGCSYDDNAILDKITELEDNKIYYTTSDNTKLFPKTDASLYGATLISNTYKNGQGILVFDDAVTSIGDSAFSGCSSLTSITIPDSVTSIGYMAFSDCDSLTDTYVNITDLAAYAAHNITSMILCKKHLMIDDTEITELVIPDSVTSIGNWAFFGCTSLTSITIPDSVTSIGEAAFYGCISLTSITIPDGVTSIGVAAFCGCFSLTSITIPDGVTSIGEQAFLRCESLTSITIPDSVTEIGEHAFAGCESLKEVYCKPTTPPSGDKYMFYLNASGRKIYVPTESVEAYKAADGWKEYANDIVGYDFE
jgi:hypothetical protein